MVVYVIASYVYPVWFGSFKKKFRKFHISQYFYVFSSIERLVTAALIVCLSPGMMAAGSVSAVFLIETIFIAVNKPYVLGQWKRPLFNKVMTVFVCLLYLGASVTKADTKINEVIPLGILLVLLSVLTIGTIGAVS